MKKSILDNDWALRIISLFIAIFLFIFVRMDNNKRYDRDKINKTASVESVETISNVPVAITKLPSDMYVTGLPDTVTVRLSGPRNLLNQITADDVQVATEDLTKISLGSRTIRLEASELPEGIRSQVTPSQVFVTVSQRQTLTVPVQIDIAPDVAEEGYYVSDIKLTPEIVTLSGKDTVMGQLSQAKIKITSQKPQKETFKSDFKLQLLDEKGNLLDISSDVTEISAEVKIEKDAKLVPINLQPKHEDTSKYKYRYRFNTSSSVVIKGSTQALSEVDKIDVHIDVQDLKEDSIVTGNMILPSGIQVEDDVVEVQVFIEEKQ